jgi:hypothetical protein
MTAIVDSILVDVYPCLNYEYTWLCPLDVVREGIKNGSVYDIWEALRTTPRPLQQTQKEILAYNLIMATLKFYHYLDSGPVETVW